MLKGFLSPDNLDIGCYIFRKVARKMRITLNLVTETKTFADKVLNTLTKSKK